MPFAYPPVTAVEVSDNKLIPVRDASFLVTFPHIKSLSVFLYITFITFYVADVVAVTFVASDPTTIARHHANQCHTTQNITGKIEPTDLVVCFLVYKILLVLH